MKDTPPEEPGAGAEMEDHLACRGHNRSLTWGTKPLPPQRLQELQALMNMGNPPTDNQEEKVESLVNQLKGIREVLTAGILVTQMHGA